MGNDLREAVLFGKWATGSSTRTILIAAFFVVCGIL